MKILITGATGYVASILIPELIKHNHKLLLVSRNINDLKSKYPHLNICEYDKLAYHGKNYDVFLNLAVVNNNSRKKYPDFLKINRDLLYELVQISKSIKIKYFLNIASFHQLNMNDNSNYAKSKREGKRKIQKIKGLKILNIYLPFIYGNRWPKKIQILNYLPLRLSKLIFYIISAFFPTLNIKILATFISQNLKSYKKNDIYLHDSKSKNLCYILITRLIDVSISIFIIGVFGWLMIFIYFLIKFERIGNPIFIQKRIGQNKKCFNLFKFRTMRPFTQELGTHLISKNNVTKIGEYLRVFKLDELPQVINILKNELTFVGPRPSLLSQEALIEKRQENKILDIKPGLTGYSQINHIDMSDVNRLVKFDYYYFINKSLIIDFKIIIKTFLGIGFKDNVIK